MLGCRYILGAEGAKTLENEVVFSAKGAKTIGNYLLFGAEGAKTNENKASGGPRGPWAHMSEAEWSTLELQQRGSVLVSNIPIAGLGWGAS